MNLRALRNMQNKADSNFFQRFKSYKKSLRDCLLQKDDFVIVYPKVTKSIPTKTTIHHAVATIHSIDHYSNTCVLKWVTDGPKKEDKPGNVCQSSWPIPLVLKVEDGSDKQKMIRNIADYSVWGRNYEVADVLAKFIPTDKSECKYLVWWSGYSILESTWERRENITDKDLDVFIRDNHLPVFKGELVKMKDEILDKLIIDLGLEDEVKDDKFTKKEELFFSRVLKKNLKRTERTWEEYTSGDGAVQSYPTVELPAENVVRKKEFNRGFGK